MGFVIARVMLGVPVENVVNVAQLTAGLGVYLLGAAGIAALDWRLSGLGGLMQADPQRIRRSSRRHSVLTAMEAAWLLGGLAALFALGLGAHIERLGLASVPLADTAAAVAPFVVALVISWLLEYPLARQMRQRAVASAAADAPPPAIWTLGQYLGFNFRHQLLFVAAPIGVILLVHDSLWLYVEPLLRRWGLTEPTAQAVVGSAVLVSAVATIVAAPAMIVRIWRTSRVQAGELRQQLMEMCDRLRIRCREILIWQTGGVVANAGVMGLVARVRYVLLSDGLLAGMDSRQVQAVFAHEAGHVVGRHLVYSMLFLASSITLCGLGSQLLMMAGAGPWVSQALPVAAMGAVFIWGFSWISRRFERQSDVVAAWACGGADADGRINPEGAALFASALRRVGELNGIAPRHRNRWHGPLEDRINYILYLGSTAGTRGGIDRLVRRIKLMCWLLVLAAVAGVTVMSMLGP
jgi:Zn-dependent protease with chaperone function